MAAPAADPVLNLDGGQAAMRWNGAHVALIVASGMVLQTVSELRMFVLLVFLMLGCAMVLLSPAHRAISMAVERAVELFTAPPAAVRVDRREAALRWTGFHVLLVVAPWLLLNTTVVAAAEALEEPPVNKLHTALLFAVFMAGVWQVGISTFHRRMPRTMRPAAAVVAQGLDDFFFGGQFAGSDMG